MDNMLLAGLLLVTATASSGWNWLFRMYLTNSVNWLNRTQTSEGYVSVITSDCEEADIYTLEAAVPISITWAMSFINLLLSSADLTVFVVSFMMYTGLIYSLYTNYITYEFYKFNHNKLLQLHQSENLRS